MCLEVGRVDHYLVRQGREDTIEHPQTAPPDETVVNRLVRTVILWCIAPAQTVPDDKDNATDNLPVIDTWDPVRQRKIRLDPAHLRLRQQKQITHDNASLAMLLNQSIPIHTIKLIGPEPRCR